MFMKPKSILLCVVLLLFAWCLCRFILCFCAQISILLDRCESSFLYVGTAFNRGNISEKCMAWDASWLLAKLKETSVGSLPSQWFGVQMRSLSYLILSYLILSIYLSLSVYLSVCLSIFPSVHLSIHPSIHPSIYLSTITHPNSKHFRRCRFSWISLEETKKTCEPRKKIRGPSLSIESWLFNRDPHNRLW